MNKALEGVRILDMTHVQSGPTCTQLLAWFGADVIKIERPGVGDFARGYDQTVKGLSSHFVWLNRSKESLALDLKRPEAAEVLTRLLDKADVFVQNLAPGAAERLGLGVETLRKARPRLIICGVSGYGSTGPYRDKKAYDLLVQAESGLVGASSPAATKNMVVGAFSSGELTGIDPNTSFNYTHWFRRYY